jgi:hypothetical protein
LNSGELLQHTARGQSRRMRSQLLGERGM